MGCQSDPPWGKVRNHLPQGLFAIGGTLSSAWCRDGMHDVGFHRGSRAEEVEEHFLAMGKDSLHVVSDKEPVDQRSAKHSVANVVETTRAAVAWFETVLVNPLTIGAAQLLIDEPEWRFPYGELGAPAHWEAAQSDPVVDQSARTHDNWRWREDFELQPSWRDLLKIARVGEERENLLARPGQPQFGAEFKNTH